MVLILSFCFLNIRQNILLSASRWQVYFDLMKLNFPFSTLLLLDVLSALFFFYFPQTVQPLLPLLSLSLRGAVRAARGPAGAPAEAGRQDGPQMPEQE